MLAAHPPLRNLSPAEEASEIDTLRAQISELSSEVAKMVEFRARQVQRAAGQATDATREKIGDYPLATIAGAFAAGAVIGLLLTEGKSEPRSRYESARDDLASYANDLKRSLSHTAREYSLTDRLDRMASALSTTDAKEAMGPAFDRVLGWFGQAKDKAKSVAETAAAKVMG